MLHKRTQEQPAALHGQGYLARHPIVVEDAILENITPDNEQEILALLL